MLESYLNVLISVLLSNKEKEKEKEKEKRYWTANGARCWE